jgi:hypothetical protein
VPNSTRVSLGTCRLTDAHDDGVLFTASHGLDRPGSTGIEAQSNPGDMEKIGVRADRTAAPVRPSPDAIHVEIEGLLRKQK